MFSLHTYVNQWVKITTDQYFIVSKSKICFNLVVSIFKAVSQDEKHRTEKLGIHSCTPLYQPISLILK